MKTTTSLRHLTMLVLAVLLGTTAEAASVYKPWSNGRLRPTANQRYLEHENGRPFFWLANTAWLMPERLNRDEVAFYLSREHEAGFNVEQVQVLNGIPTFNVYGHQANDTTFCFDAYTQPGVYGYWDHLDYIVDMAAQQGIYIAMDCIWGSQISRMDTAQAARYGRFLGERYRGRPNIVWMIGGDVMGDRGMASWEALARAIRQADPGHLMTFHPRGRTTSAWWFNDRDWLDFNMFQSGHRRYDQRNGDANYTIEEGTEEDNWRYVVRSRSGYSRDGREVRGPQKPVLDGEPSYEAIPQGLHDTSAPRWQARDVRRYAYWAVMAGCCGHTYGHNSIMQFYRPGLSPAYGADETWWDALSAPGRNQMKYLKWLMLALPFTQAVADDAVVLGTPGERYQRVTALRSTDFMLVYDYSGRPFELDLTPLSGTSRKAWLMTPADGTLRYLGLHANGSRVAFDPASAGEADADRILIVTDAAATYFAPTQTALTPREQ